MNTIDYYNQNAKSYFDKTVDAKMKKQYDMFLKYVKENGKILDFGCGSGRDGLFFKDNGYDVTLIDGSIELCKLASEYTGLDVKCMDFKDFNDIDMYDGVWACSTLLHIPRKDMLDILKRIRYSLKENGYLFASFQDNDKEEYKSDGRYFSDLTVGNFVSLADMADFKVVDSMTNYSGVKAHQEKYGNQGITWHSLILNKK